MLFVYGTKRTQNIYNDYIASGGASYGARGLKPPVFSQAPLYFFIA